MQQDLNEIEKIKEHNSKQGELFSPWPAIMFFLGLIIAALYYRHTM